MKFLLKSLREQVLDSVDREVYLSNVLSLSEGAEIQAKMFLGQVARETYEVWLLGKGAAIVVLNQLSQKYNGEELGKVDVTNPGSIHDWLSEFKQAAMSLDANIKNYEKSKEEVAQ